MSAHGRNKKQQHETENAEEIVRAHPHGYHPYHLQPAEKKMREGERERQRERISDRWMNDAVKPSVLL